MGADAMTHALAESVCHCDCDCCRTMHGPYSVITERAIVAAVEVEDEIDQYPFLLAAPEVAELPAEMCEVCGRTVRHRRWPIWHLRGEYAGEVTWAGEGCYRKYLRERGAAYGDQLALTAYPEGESRA